MTFSSRVKTKFPLCAVCFLCSGAHVNGHPVHSLPSVRHDIHRYQRVDEPLPPSECVCVCMPCTVQCAAVCVSIHATVPCPHLLFTCVALSQPDKHFETPNQPQNDIMDAVIPDVNTHLSIFLISD